MYNVEHRQEQAFECPLYASVVRRKCLNRVLREALANLRCVPCAVVGGGCSCMRCASRLDFSCSISGFQKVRREETATHHDQPRTEC
eukprot:5441953-Amphidinium_carterae.1